MENPFFLHVGPNEFGRSVIKNAPTGQAYSLRSMVARSSRSLIIPTSKKNDPDRRLFKLMKSLGPIYNLMISMR